MLSERKILSTPPSLVDFHTHSDSFIESFGFHAAYYSLNTTSKIFSKLKDLIPSNERSGVYKLSCSDCQALYIGQTGRELKFKISEHNPACPRNAASEEEDGNKSRLLSLKRVNHFTKKIVR